MKMPIYLDTMATTPVDPRVAAKMQQCLTQDGLFGNPASRSHVYGWQAEEAVDAAREQVANLIQAQPKEIIWTSGATEADNLAIKGAAYFYKRKGQHIITCKTEHHAVLDTCQTLERQGFEVTYLNPKSNGLIDCDELEKSIRRDTILISIMHVNNEIGVIQDIKTIGELAKKRGVLFHVDAAQSAGKIPIDVSQMLIDLMSFSAHKIYGPKGIGALYVRRKPRVRLEPMIHGGGHETGLRSGTLATHQIVGMGEAFAIANAEMVGENQRIKKLRDQFWAGLQALQNITINGDVNHMIPGCINICFKDLIGETLMVYLKDLAVSSGSACTSATIEPSHVLKACGLSDAMADSSIRFSIGRFTTENEIEFAINQVIESVLKLRMMSPNVELTR